MRRWPLTLVETLLLAILIVLVCHWQGWLLW